MTFLTYDQGNFNQITARSRTQTLVIVVRDTCTTTVPLTPVIFILRLRSEGQKKNGDLHV